MKFRISRKSVEIKKILLLTALDAVLAFLISNIFYQHVNKVEIFFIWFMVIILVPVACVIKASIYSFFVFNIVTKHFFENEIYIMLKKSNLPNIDGHYFYDPYQYLEEMLNTDISCEEKQKACTLLGYFRGVSESKSGIIEKMMFESCLKKATEKYLSELEQKK